MRQADDASACCAPQRGGPRPVDKEPVNATSREGPLPETLVSVPGGRFRMGSDDSFAYPEDGEAPVHEVLLRPFLIDSFAVSNDRFAQFVDATGFVTDAERWGWSFVFSGLLPDDFPPT